MDRYAQLINGVIHQIIESETDPDGINGEWIACGNAGPGWTYNGTTFEAPTLPPIVAPRIMTHLEFRRLFTPLEQELSDELEATFESNNSLTVEQKRKLRTGYKNFNAATTVDRDDPDIPPMLNLYVTLGILEPHRPVEILE